jgi:uncharacterized protein YdaU (DUF1376 family)
MQLYVSDFVGDTLRLSAELVGAYMLLLMAMWNGDGELLDDEAELALVARIQADRWPAVWAKLAPFFDIADGKVTHGRIKLELQKFARKSAARKEAGSRGGKAKALKDKNTGLAIATPNAMASSRNHIKKGAQALLDPTDKTEDVSRHVEPDVFAECVRRTEPVKAFIEHKQFPAALVAEVRAQIKSQESVH